MAGRKKKTWLPEYSPTEEQQEAYMWGVEEGIIISPMAVKGKPGTYHIGIASHWKPKDVKYDPVTYEGKEVQEKVFDYYVHYYNRRES